MLHLHDVHKSFGDHHVLRGVSFSVARGEIVALLGPNGAGKTTAIGILTTLIAPDSGTATIDGFDVTTHAPDVRRRISVTGQSVAVDGILTGRENLRMLAELSGLRPRASRHRADELLERFALTAAANQRVARYSGGMRRRLDLALTLVTTPLVVVLDEPTTGLDTRSRQDLWDAIDEIAANGSTVLLTTQYLDEADRLAHRALVLDDGRIVADGTPAELKRRVGSERISVTSDDGTLLHDEPVDSTLSGLRAHLDELTDTGIDGRVTLRSPSMDDVFLALTHQHTRTLTETR